jgi:hypothetical protein
MQNSLSKLMFAKALTSSIALLAVTAPALAVGCSGAPPSTDSGTVTGTAVAYNRSTHALADTALTSIHGSYGNPQCVNHPGNWVVNIGTAVGSTLTVTKNSTGCLLRITSLVAGATTYVALAGPPLNTVSGLFAATAVAFTGGAGIAFYANADVTPADFSTDFVLNIFTSDDANPQTGPTNTATTILQSTGSQTGVLAPDYTVAVPGDDTIVETDDTDGGVSVVNGSVTLTPTAQGGEAYVIDTDPTFAPGFGADNTAFNAGDKVAIPIGGPFTIQATDFFNVGDRLPQTRTVIIQHVDGDAGMVVTYETVQFVFSP